MRIPPVAACPPAARRRSPAADRADSVVAPRRDPRRRRHGGPRGRQRGPSPRLRLCRRAGSREYGLEPAGENGGWFQTVTLEERTIQAAGTRAALVTGGARRRSPSPATSFSASPAGRRPSGSTRRWSSSATACICPRRGMTISPASTCAARSRWSIAGGPARTSRRSEVARPGRALAAARRARRASA